MEYDFPVLLAGAKNNRTTIIHVCFNRKLHSCLALKKESKSKTCCIMELANKNKKIQHTRNKMQFSPILG